MKQILLFLFISSTLFSSSYEGCSHTKQDALFSLSGNIRTSIVDNFEQTTTSDSKSANVEEKIESYMQSSTNLSLVNIKYKKKGESEICAYIEKQDQTQNSKKLLEKALLYEEKNLPKDIDKKIKLLSVWLDDIEQLGYLLSAFVDDSKEGQEKLNKKEKVFNDLYTDSIAKSDSLVFKSCEQTEEKAKISLNKQMFKNSTKEEKKGFFDSITSLFETDKELMLDLFDEQIFYVKKEKTVCAVIKKESLLRVANSMYSEVKRFNEKSLSQKPKEKYKEITNYYEHLNVTKSLLSLFPETFNKKHFKKINSVRLLITKIQKTTYPQFVLFNIKGANNITITLDGKKVKNNEEFYVKKGEHTYTIKAKNRCSFKASFENNLFDDKTVSEDFSEMNFPTVIFLTDKTPNIVVDGKVVQVNVSTQIKKCDGEVHYIAKFVGQSKTDTLALLPNTTQAIELNFLSKEELTVFNDAKTKKFKTTSEAKFSESLTPVSSENLVFTLNSSPEHGKLTLNEKGSFRYQSEKDFVGYDSFEYVVKSQGKISSPKVVSIAIMASKILKTPKKTLPKKRVEEKLIVVDDANSTTEKIVQKIQEIKEEAKQVKDELIEKTKEELKAVEKRYERFKDYVNSQDQNIEKLKKLQEKYPQMFKKLLEEKLK